jgi:hypothetical protein
MLKKTELRESSLGWIRSLPRARVFDLSEIYRFLEYSFPDECNGRGDAKMEPRCRNDARWAVFDAKRERLIAPTGRRGEYRRY